jgi:hypothetical protein
MGGVPKRSCINKCLNHRLWELELDAQDGGMAVEVIIDGLGCTPQSRVVDITIYNMPNTKGANNPPFPKDSNKNRASP